jgi:hypothetical protein
MSEEKDNFHKKFEEIVNSDDLKKIHDEFEAEVKMGTKELLLIQQSLADSISHISEVLMERNTGSFEFIFTADSIYHSLLGSLYKISEDFNEVMVEYYLDLDDDDDDDDLEDDIEEDGDENSDGPF